jgi:putative ABC transport system permease protein
MMGSADRGERLYRWLIRLYPAEFRRRYGGRLVEAFIRQRSDHEAAGGGFVVFWASIVADVAVSAVRLRVGSIAERIGWSGGTGAERTRKRREPVMATILSDVRYAWRGLFRNRSFAVAALSTITLAIAASTAVFSVVDVALIRPLPLEDPDRLLFLAETHAEQVGSGLVAPETLRDWVEETTTFEAFAASAFNSRIWVDGDRAEVVTAADVNDRFFEVLGRGAQLGRAFTEGDGERGEWLTVLSDAFWRSRLGGDPGVIGRTLSLDGRTYTVVGVMPPRFAIPDGDVPMWTLETWSGDTGRGGRYLAVAGRLAPGRTAEQAESELDAIATRIAESFPATNEGWDVSVTPLRDTLIGAVAAPIRLIGVAVALLLLVASFNVAGLMLARGAARRREMAVRQALGGGWRIVRLLVVESVLIAGIGGVLGVVLASVLVRALVANPPIDIPLIETVSIDGRALAFAFSAVALTGLVFGLVPAWRASGASTSGAQALRSAVGTEAKRGSTTARVRAALVVGEIAIAVVLVIGAALLLRSLVALNAVDPGFETEDRVAARVFLDGEAYRDPAQRNAWVLRVQDGVAAIPGVRAVGTISVLPMEQISVNFDLPYGTRSTSGLSRQDLPQAEFRVVSGDIFDAMGIDLVRGRGFRESDDTNAPHVVVINETLAAQAFPGVDPIGEQMAVYWAAGAVYEVIGVAGDTHQSGLSGAPSPQLYVHFPQLSLPFGATNIVAATDGVAVAPLRGMEDAVLAADPGQPAHGVFTLESVVRDSIARERFATTLLTGLAALALILAALGLYGLVSYIVRQRSRELAIRMALGARRANAVGSVLGHSVSLATGGAVIGVVAAGAGTQFVESLLFDVSPVDPLTYALVPVILVAVAALAAARPAWTAANADPAAVLRQE